jgi:CysZ protein
VRQLFEGAGCLVRGLRIFAGTPGLWALGLGPALIALVVLVAMVAALVVALPGVVAALTPFAGGWSADARDALRVVIGLAILVGAGWLAMVSYTAVALAIGQPFYEAISSRVDALEGAGAEPLTAPGAWWRGVGRAIRDGLLLVALTATLSACLFVLGFVPLIGQTVVPVLGACVTGWFLAVELSAIALERRGYRLGDRLALLWRRRLLTIGFGVAVFLLFLVPLGAVLGMPAAVAGGTLLARRAVR